MPSNLPNKNPLSYFGVRAENPPDLVQERRAPTTTDTSGPNGPFTIGTLWVDTTTGIIYGLGNSAAGVATWTVLGPGSSDVDTLTGDTGGAISPIGGNINIIGGDGLTVAGTPGTLTINRDSAGGYPITPYVVGAAGEAGYATIQAGLDAANAAGGGAVYVQPGTYTENLTLYPDTQIVGVAGNSDAGTAGNSTIIVGVHTPPTTGSHVFKNVRLESATHIFSSVAAGSAALVLENVFIVVTNGYTFDLPNWTGGLVVYNVGEGSTNNGVVNNTGGAVCFFISATLGAGTGQVMNTSGLVDLQEIDLNCPWNAQTGTIIDCLYVAFTQTTTFSNNSTGTLMACQWSTGANAAVTMSSTAAISIINSQVTSTNNPAITGAGVGTLTIISTSFTNNAELAATLTLGSGELRGAGQISRFIVGPAPDSPYQTIQSAIDAAVAAGGVSQTIFVKPGTYTEDLDFSGTTAFTIGLTMMGAVALGDEGQCEIIGTHTPPTTGTLLLRNFRLSDATAIFSSAAAGSARLVLIDAELNVTNGYSFDVLNWTGTIELFDINPGFGVNDGGINNTGGASFFLFSAGLGVGTGNTMNLSGLVVWEGSNSSCPIDFGTGSMIQIDGSVFNQTITCSGNSTGQFNNCRFNGGANAALTMSSSAAVTLTSCIMQSTNNPAIAGAGAGTLNLGNITYTSNQAKAATLTIGSSDLNEATAFRTTPLATGCTFSGNKIEGTGSDANIDFTITPKGTGKLEVDNGNIEASAGNVVISGAGQHLQVEGGAATDFIGQATLVAGTVTVANTNITATDKIFLQRQGINASTALGILDIAITAGVNFTITSRQASSPGMTETNDTSIIDYFIVRQL